MSFAADEEYSGSSSGSSSFSDEDDDETFFADRLVEDAHTIETPHMSRNVTEEYDGGDDEKHEVVDSFSLLQNATLLLDKKLSDNDILQKEYDDESLSRRNSCANISGNSPYMPPRGQSKANLTREQLEEQVRERFNGSWNGNGISSLSSSIHTSVSENEGEREMHRISCSTNIDVSSYQNRVRNMPRDPTWGFVGILFITLSFGLPFHLSYRTHHSSIDDSNYLMSLSNSNYVFHAKIWSVALTFVIASLLCQWIYRSVGEERHKLVTTKIVLSNVTSIIGQIVLSILMWWHSPGAKVFLIAPLVLLWREVSLFRRKRRDTISGQNDGKVIFFHVLASMSLQILSRSLKRSAMTRLVFLMVILQTLLVLFWCSSFFACASLSGQARSLIIASSIVGGVWATNILKSTLATVATAGVMKWMSKQAILVEEREKNMSEESTGKNSHHWSGPSLESFLPTSSRAYKPINHNDEFDEDDPDENDDLPNHLQDTFNILETPGPLKPILISSMTISFGSIVHCALLSGIAEGTSYVLQSLECLGKIKGSKRDGNGFQGMQIGDANNLRPTSRLSVISRMYELAYSFARSRSEYGLPFVAAYFKPYRSASIEVSGILETSGVIKAIREDLSSSLCRSIGISVSTWMTIFVGYFVMTVKANNLSDKEVAAVLLLVFAMNYTVIITVFEPLRASIRAAYVAFAQHPQCLRLAFPIIYHRLVRLSQEDIDIV